MPDDVVARRPPDRVRARLSQAGGRSVRTGPSGQVRQDRAVAVVDELAPLVADEPEPDDPDEPGPMFVHL
jgi:hypothetical protein